MPGLLTSCTVGMSGRASTPADPSTKVSSSIAGINESLDPLLDLSLPEEQELPFMTVATTTPLPSSEDEESEEEMLSIVQMESGVHVSYLETLFAVGIDGCKQVRDILNGVIKKAGKRVLEGEGVVKVGGVGEDVMVE